MEDKHCSPPELVAKIFEYMTSDARKVNFPPDQKPKTLIADDSDHHRTRTGSLLYQDVAITDIGRAPWILAFGIAVGSYPKDPYRNAFTAIRMPYANDAHESIVVQKVDYALTTATYFRCSLLIAMSDTTIVSLSNDREVRALRSIFGFTENGDKNDDIQLPYGEYECSVVGNKETYSPDHVERVGDYFLERLAGRSEQHPHIPVAHARECAGVFYFVQISRVFFVNFLEASGVVLLWVRKPEKRFAFLGLSLFSVFYPSLFYHPNCFIASKTRTNPPTFAPRT